jgi:hypothetical protein
VAQFLKQSTAFTFRIGPFVDSTDGVTAETALSIAQADIQISKAGGAFAQTSASPTTTHDADGWYQCPLTTTDTGTVGTLTVQIVMAGALPVWKDFTVIPANVYDSLIGGTDLLDVSVTQFGGTAGTFSAGRPEVNASHFAGTAYATALAAEVDAFHDEQVDGTVTFRQSTRLQNAVLAGKASGLATTTAVYRDLADTKDRISATVDADGNRSAVTRDVS